MGSWSIAISAWAVQELQWAPGDGWYAGYDHPALVDDQYVLRWFGDEAFRRRDVLRREGGNQYRPYGTDLVGRRVRDMLTAASWHVQEDSPLRFTAVSGDLVRDLDGGVQQRIVASGSGDSLTFDRLDAAEQWLLSAAFPDEASVRSTIVTRGCFDAKEGACE